MFTPQGVWEQAIQCIYGLQGGGKRLSRHHKFQLFTGWWSFQIHVVQGISVPQFPLTQNAFSSKLEMNKWRMVTFMKEKKIEWFIKIRENGDEAIIQCYYISALFFVVAWKWNLKALKVDWLEIQFDHLSMMPCLLWSIAIGLSHPNFPFSLSIFMLGNHESLIIDRGNCWTWWVVSFHPHVAFTKSFLSNQMISDLDIWHLP